MKSYECGGETEARTSIMNEGARADKGEALIRG